MARKSAGVLMYRFRCDNLEVFLVHPGGPYWSKKDLGSWSIPKGEYADSEDPFQVARREFFEETGFEAAGDFRALTPLKQPGGKVVTAWAVQGDCDPDAVTSNLFTMEWPPKSGIFKEFPEVDRGEWFTVRDARKKVLKGQVPFIDQLCEILGICVASVSCETNMQNQQG